MNILGKIWRLAVAAIAGGLAGLYYGYERILEEQLKVIKKREWIEEMCEKALYRIGMKY